MSDKTQTPDVKELKIVTGRERKGFVPEYGEEMGTFSASPSLMYSYCMH